MSQIEKQLSLIWLYILWGFNIVIFTPYILLQTITFYKLRHEPYIAKRKHILICILIFIIIVTLDIIEPILAWNEILNFQYVLPIWTNASIFLLYTFLILRTWKLFYDFEQEKQLLDVKWMRIIRSHKLYIPWTLKYPKLGNVKLLILTTLIIDIFIYLLLYNLNEFYSTIILISFLVLLIIISIYPAYIILKMVHDFYQIHKELRYIFGLAFVIVLLFIIDILPNKPIHSLIMYTIYSIIFILLSLIQTKWVFYKKNRWKRHVTQRREHGSIVLAKDNNDTINHSNHSQTHNLQLKDILKSESGFKIFANHLLAELTVEHLLFILEVMQIKWEMLNFELLNEDKIGFILQLPSPFINRNDAIIYNVGDDDEYSLKFDDDDDDNDNDNNNHNNALLAVFTYTDIIDDFSYLIEMYIDYDAQHSLNISSKIRKNLIKKTKECKEKFAKLDKLHQMTSTRSLHSLKGLHLNDDNNQDIDDDNNKNNENNENIKAKSMIEAEMMRSVENICFSIRFGHFTSINEAEFDEFVETEHENANDKNEEDVVDHKNHNRHSLHYNIRSQNVQKMKEMVEDLIIDLDKALNEVYRLIEKDSFSRFIDTHEYIALEKLLYKQNQS